jgi:hypothetical protein
MALSFSKLTTGAWGIRGTGITIGIPLGVTKRDGSITRVVASRIIWTGDDGTQIAQLESTPRSTAPARSASRRPGRGCSCTDDCCARGCRCEAHCNCNGGPIHDC